MRGLLGAAVAIALLAGGCGSSSGGKDGTCPDSVTYQGTSYRANLKDESVQQGAVLGTGTKPGCTKGPDHDDYDVTVVRLVGTDPSDGVGVEDQPGIIYQPQP